MDLELQTLIFMGLVLKIPLAFACWLVWWAIRSEPEPAEAEDDGGLRRDHFRRSPKPKRPQGPRRGPHSPDSAPLPCPEQGGIKVLRRPVTAPAIARARSRD